jgi:two-component system NtrC family sensor kinase
LNLDLPSRPDEPSTLGFNLKMMTIEPTGPVKVMVFSDITNILKDRLAMEMIKEELFQSKKMASVGTMISGVVHELNNPLTGISMSTELTRLSLEKLLKQVQAINAQPDSAKPLPPAKLQAALENTLAEVGRISTASRKAAALVSDLLTYSRPVQLKLTPYGIQPLVQECIHAIKTHPEFTGITFQVSLMPETVQVLCEKVKLEQVFYNLFKNASDAMNGKGTIEVSMSLSEGTGNTKKHVTVHVRDFGVGMDKHVMSRIFEPFFTTKGNTGLGLGLSLSFRTVEQHGGILSVDSVLGEGSVFHVAIPVHEETEGQYPV